MDERSGDARTGSDWCITLTELCAATDIGARLRGAGIPLTLQRVAVAHVMLASPAHLAADDVLARARMIIPEISRATVYNTLKLFSQKGLVREILANAEHVVFDSNTAPHHHLYDVDTGTVIDVPAGEIEVVGRPTLPAGTEIESIDLVIRVRRKSV